MRYSNFLRFAMTEIIIYIYIYIHIYTYIYIYITKIFLAFELNFTGFSVKNQKFSDFLKIKYQKINLLFTKFNLPVIFHLSKK